MARAASPVPSAARAAGERARYRPVLRGALFCEGWYGRPCRRGNACTTPPPRLPTGTGRPTRLPRSARTAPRERPLPYSGSILAIARRARGAKRERAREPRASGVTGTTA